MQLKETGTIREENTTLVAPVLTLLNAIDSCATDLSDCVCTESRYLFRHSCAAREH